MTAASLAIIGATIVVSAFISGVFGMAGGMVLLGVLLVYFDVATAMVLFSIIQLASNGWRALHWRQFVLWPIFWWYVFGGALAFCVMRYIAFVPDKATVYILLGLLPFAVEVLPARMRPNIEWRGIPFFTGITTTIVQFMTRRRRAVPRHFLPEEPARPQDHQRHQGGGHDRQPCPAGGLFRIARGHRRFENRGLGSGGRAGARRRDPGAVRTRADDRPWLPAMDARDHLRPRHGLFDPRRLAALAGRLNAPPLRPASREHLEPAVERYQAGLDPKLGLLVFALLAKFGQ